MAFRQWERYLFESHNLVALNLGKDNIKLFSVLLKKRMQGSRPVLIELGNLVDIQYATDENPAWEETEADISDFLNGELEEEQLVGIVDIVMNGSLECTADQASNVLFKLLNLLNLGGSWSQNLHWRASNVSTERINSGLVKSLFYAQEHQAALWSPDMKRIELEKPISRDGMTELWVVTEIKYCTELMIKTKVGSSGAAGVKIPEGLTGIPVSAGVTATRSKAGDLVVKGDKVPLGFKAIRLVYDSQGNLQQMMSEMVLPKVRANELPDSLDPDKHPGVHLGPLFADENEEVLECLDIMCKEVVVE